VKGGQCRLRSRPAPHAPAERCGARIALELLRTNHRSPHRRPVALSDRTGVSRV